MRGEEGEEATAGERHRAPGRRVERGGEEGGGRASCVCAGGAGSAQERARGAGREGVNEGGRGRGRREGGGDFFIINLFSGPLWLPGGGKARG